MIDEDTNMNEEENFENFDNSGEEESLPEEAIEKEENINEENIIEESELPSISDKSKSHLNMYQKYFTTENLDLDFSSSFYTSRQIEIEQFRSFLKKESNHGLTGIKNLGNSCYINTVLQCLSHSVELTYFFVSQLYAKEINTTQGNALIKRGLKPGTLSNLLSKIFSSLWVNEDKFITPTELRFLISNSIPQFNNTNQQDSHEMLMYFLDLIHEDLNQAQIQTGNSKYLEECPPKMSHESDISAAKRFWNYHIERNNSIIVDLFTGQLKNTIECLMCGNKSVKFDPFVTLPLAIPNMKRVDVIVVPAINVRSVIKITLYVSDSALFRDLPLYLKKYIGGGNNNLNMNVERFRFLLVNGKSQTAKFTKNADNVYNMSKKGFIFAYEIDERISEEDEYYPFITLIREKEEKSLIMPQIENKEKIENNNQIENQNENKIKIKKDYTGDILNCSFPHLFAITPLSSVKELRQNLYGFMRKFYHPSIALNETVFKNKFSKFSSNYSECHHLDEIEYEEIIKEEYNFFFSPSNNTLDENILKLKQEYLSNLPYSVSLFSTKNESKTRPKVFFSNSYEDYSKTINDSSKIEKLIDIIKTGFKLVIEINTNFSQFEDLKLALNSMISITNKEKEMEFTKTPTIQDCLDHFRLTEKLDKGNEWYCSNCKKLQNAYRKIELFYVPKNFIIVFNRFETKMLGKFKIQILKNNNFVKYPVNGLNLSHFIEGAKDKPIYDLYSVSQHSGSVEGGHYATACKNFGKWYEIDDLSLFPSEEDFIVSPEGYILFFRRQEKKN